MVIEDAILMIATNLDITNATEIQKNGLTALKDAKGVTASIKFLEQFDKGDFTEEKYLDEGSEPTDDEIRKMFGF